MKKKKRNFRVSFLEHIYEIIMAVIITDLILPTQKRFYFKIFAVKILLVFFIGRTRIIEKKIRGRRRNIMIIFLSEIQNNVVC